MSASSSPLDSDSQLVASTVTAAAPEKKNLSNIQLRWITGLVLGGIATSWIAAGPKAFVSLFLPVAISSQGEYFGMVKAMDTNNVGPSVNVGIVATVLCSLIAYFMPEFHQFVLPLSFLVVFTSQLLSKRRNALSFNTLAGTMMGILHIGYLPSFWVRLVQESTQFSNLRPEIPGFLDFLTKGLLGGRMTQAPAILWWTWLCIAFSDVGAYFTGKTIGKNKLSVLSSPAGAASPNKTLEGCVGGFLTSMALATWGAHTMRWANWKVLGPLYGLLIGFVGLLGDLAISVLKREAKMKDSGNLLPGHGGILDRIDSYLLTAPVCYLFCKLLL